MKKSTIGVVVATLALSFSLVACGGSQEAVPQADAPEETAAEEQAEPEATEEKVLDSQAIMDIVLDACPLDLAQIDNIKVGAVKDGVCEVTFDSEAGPFSYSVNATTGEIVDRVEPEVSAEVQAHDPTEEAINACMDAIEGYSGGAENISVKFVTVDGVDQIEVELDWNGEHYDMFYDPAAGQVVS